MLTCFTQHSFPSCNTRAGVNSCTSATILTGAGAQGCNKVVEVTWARAGSWLDRKSKNIVCTLCVSAYMALSIEANSHSTVHQTGRFYCLIPAVCSLHHRCRTLQSCRLYWRDCVDHLWEYQDHRSQWLYKQEDGLVGVMLV